MGIRPELAGLRRRVPAPLERAVGGRARVGCGDDGRGQGTGGGAIKDQGRYEAGVVGQLIGDDDAASAGLVVLTDQALALGERAPGAVVQASSEANLRSAAAQGQRTKTRRPKRRKTCRQRWPPSAAVRRASARGSSSSWRARRSR